MKTGGRLRWLSAIVLMLLIVPTFGAPTSFAQQNCRTFPETGKTVCDKFLDYWNNNGGLAQQGYPISDTLQEVSDTDGKTYTVQYFERAVFELHPENQPPYDVLLSLLGTFLYQQKYGQAGASGQVPNTSAGSRLFPETGRRVGGVFLDYWNTHGGLAQQGYPISDEFQEVSDLNGQTYKVQYFERAVFEFHPENQPPYDVLLSQLGTFRYRQKYTAPKATPTVAPTQPPAPPQPTAVPDCSQGVPDPRDATITPKCGPIGTIFQIHATGFTPNERISFWLTLPNGDVAGTPRPLDIGNHPGQFDDRFDSSILSGLGSQVEGIWAITYQGEQSNHQSIVWFKITPQGGGGQPPPPSGNCSGVPPSTNVNIAPSNCAPAGTTFAFNASGFRPGENVGVYVTRPDQSVNGAPFQVQANGAGATETVSLTTSSGSQQGVWAITFEGVSSRTRAIGYFKLTAP